jgi:hypothetical protein
MLIFKYISILLYPIYIIYINQYIIITTFINNIIDFIYYIFLLTLSKLNFKIIIKFHIIEYGLIKLMF